MTLRDAQFAKINIAIAALLFVANPFPLARLLAVAVVLLVNVFARVNTEWERGRRALLKEEEEATEEEMRKVD